MPLVLPIASAAFSDARSSDSIHTHAHTLSSAGFPAPGRFASQMEVSVSHSADSVTVEFGSTLDNPATSSNGFYGVSNVEILLRGIEECNYDK